MATNIVGTFPILNRQKSQTDEYGFDYITYEYTLKTETVDQFRPQKDDFFNGTLSRQYVNFNNSQSQSYVVENVEVTPMNGGLSALTIQTVGTKTDPSTASPKVFIRQGGPLIFGLEGSVGFNGAGAISGGGQEIEVKFMEYGGVAGENIIYQRYYTKVIPVIFRNTKLPTPASQPKAFDFTRTSENGLKNGTFGSYYGFVCKRVSTERRGALLLASVFYSEAGLAVSLGVSGGAQTSSILYDFPIYG